jgi:aspartate/methionine/tyrosine aminotransferase
MFETKMRISSFYQSEFCTRFEQSDLAFCHNGTAALSLVIKALAEIGVRRTLIVTPAYFSLFGIPNQYGMSIAFHHTDLLDDSSMDPDRILKTARDQLADAIFLTNPVFSTGRTLTEEHVRSLARSAESRGLWLVLDETLGGLPWQDGSQRPFVTPSMLTAIGNSSFVMPSFLLRLKLLKR